MWHDDKEMVRTADPTKLAALPFAGGEKDLRSSSGQAAENPSQGLGEALAGLPGPAIPAKPGVGLDVRPLVIQQGDDRPRPRGFGWRDFHHDPIT